MKSSWKAALGALAFSFLAPLPLLAGTSLEALKSASLMSAWESALNAPLPTAPVPGRQAIPRLEPQAEVQTYQRGGYTWKLDAESASEEAARNLQSAGLAVLSVQILEEPGEPRTYAFRIDYRDFEESGFPPRSIETYTSGAYSWSSDAESELARAKANLEAAGYVIILGQVLRQERYPWNYFYRVDYVRGRQNPGGPVYIYTSRLYPVAAEAQRDMIVMEYQLRAQGYRIYGSILYRDARTGYFFFQIRYGRS